MTAAGPDQEPPRLLFNRYHRDAPADAVYIGRGSPWGNPFVIGSPAEGKHGTREEVIAAYRVWLADRPDLLARARRELPGRALVCFCWPAPCHGEVLLEAAAGPTVAEPTAPVVEYRTGDLLHQPDLDAVGHGVNCRGVMGAGIAKAVRARWPGLYEPYRDRCASGVLRPGRGFAWVTGETRPAWVYNLATQDRPGADARLDAVEEALTGALGHAARHEVGSLGLPRLGAGIGGLEWAEVAPVIERVAAASPVRVVVVTLPGDAGRT